MIKYKKNGVTENLVSENTSNSQIGTDFGYDTTLSDKDGIVTNTAIKSALDPINADISEKRIQLKTVQNNIDKYHTTSEPPLNANIAQPIIDDINDWSTVDDSIAEANAVMDLCTSPIYKFQGDLINDNGSIRSLNGAAITDAGYQNTQAPSYTVTPGLFAAIQTSSSTTTNITATMNGFSNYHLSEGTVIKLYLPNGLYYLAQGGSAANAAITLNINNTGIKNVRYSNGKNVYYGSSSTYTPLLLAGAGGYVNTASSATVSTAFARFNSAASINLTDWIERNTATTNSGYVTFSPGISVTLMYDGYRWNMLPGQKIATVYFRQNVPEAGSTTFGAWRFAGWAECYSDGTRKWTYSYLYRAILNNTSNVAQVYLKRPIAVPNAYNLYWQKAYKYNCSNSLNSNNRVLPVSNPPTTSVTANLNYARTCSLSWTTTMASSQATIAVIEEEGKW